MAMLIYTECRLQFRITRPFQENPPAACQSRRDLSLQKHRKVGPSTLNYDGAVPIWRRLEGDATVHVLGRLGDCNPLDDRLDSLPFS